MSLTTGEGRRSFELDPVREFHLSRSRLAPGNTELSRRPNCPRILCVHTTWMLVNGSAKMIVRVAPPTAYWQDVHPDGAYVFPVGITVIHLPVADVDAVTVSVRPASGETGDGAGPEVSEGRSTVWGPEMNDEAYRVLQGPSRQILAAVLAPWLSADPAMRRLKDRKVAARCAGYSVQRVDQVLARIRKALWPDEPRKPSREELAMYFNRRGLLGPEDVQLIRHPEDCPHE